MALPLVPAIATLVGSWLFKKVTKDDGEGHEVETRKARPVPFTITFAMVFLVMWHFVLHPVLSYHYPEYGFPHISETLLGALVAIGQ